MAAVPARPPETMAETATLLDDTRRRVGDGTGFQRPPRQLREQLAYLVGGTAPDVHERLTLYKRVSSARNNEELRELQVEACYRLLLVLCGLNGRYFTRFQVKRQGRLAALLPLVPPDLAARMDTLLAAPPLQAFTLLHELEGEVLDLLARHPSTARYVSRTMAQYFVADEPPAARARPGPGQTGRAT